MKLIIILSIVCISGLKADFIDYANEKVWPELCQTGKEQSPIDFPSTYKYEDSANVLKIHSIGINPIQDISMAMKNGFRMGASPNKNYSGGVRITLNGIRLFYRFSNLNYHVVAEHTLDKKQSELELQLIHNLDRNYVNTFNKKPLLKNFDFDRNKNLIISILFNKEKNIDNAELNRLNIANKAPINRFDAKRLISIHDPYYYYQGSFTTPDCDESVNWIVFNTPLDISDAQYRAFKKEYDDANYKIGNARKVQLLQQRTIYSYEGFKPSKLKKFRKLRKFK